MVDTKQACKTFLFSDGDWILFNGYFMSKANDCLMIGSYVSGLNSELFQHTDKNHIFFLLETNKCRKAIAF